MTAPRVLVLGSLHYDVVVGADQFVAKFRPDDLGEAVLRRLTALDLVADEEGSAEAVA